MLKKPQPQLNSYGGPRAGPARENMVTARLGGDGAGVYAAPP
jgi:hypothetical protein